MYHMMSGEASGRLAAHCETLVLASPLSAICVRGGELSESIETDRNRQHSSDNAVKKFEELDDSPTRAQSFSEGERSNIPRQFWPSSSMQTVPLVTKI